MRPRSPGRDATGRLVDNQSMTRDRTQTDTHALRPAAVDFESERPASRRFGDVYYSADGAAEVERVFLEPAAVQARTRRSGATFTVAELGFGTGLNFVVTAASVRSRLHFVSFERYPLARSDLARALAPWSHRAPLAEALIDACPPCIPGWHRRFFDGGRIQLSVYFGDVEDGLADFARQQRRGVDAWFLDGFAPAKNPEMWREALFRTMADLSAAQATATTFTAAGRVRRGLAAAGFAVRRIDQRPHKRHSTAAVFTGRGRAFSPPSEVMIAGAGLAGAATARALAEKGIAAILAHRGEGIARGASAIPAAVLHMGLSPAPNAEARYRAHAFAFASQRGRGWRGAAVTGALHLPGPRTDAERLRRIAASVPPAVAEYLDPAATAQCADIPISSPGLFFPAALTISGAVLAADLARHPRIDVVSSAAPAGAPMVYATGTDTGTLAKLGCLEVTALAGQLDRFACPKPPRLPLVGDGVIVPAAASVWAGATYERRPWTPPRASAANAERYRRCLRHPPSAWLERFRGVRAVTSDHLPVVGRDGDAWCNLGHGSHGTVTALLGAEIVASALNGEVGPATVELLTLLAPGRFRERQKRRRNPFR